MPLIARPPSALFSAVFVAVLAGLAMSLAPPQDASYAARATKRDMECGGGPRYILHFCYGDTFVGSCRGCKTLRKRVAVEPLIPSTPHKPVTLPIPKFGSCSQDGGVCQVNSCSEVQQVTQGCASSNSYDVYLGDNYLGSCAGGYTYHLDDMAHGDGFAHPDKRQTDSTNDNKRAYIDPMESPFWRDQQFKTKPTTDRETAFIDPKESPWKDTTKPTMPKTPTNPVQQQQQQQHPVGCGSVLCVVHSCADAKKYIGGCNNGGTWIGSRDSGASC